MGRVTRQAGGQVPLRERTCERSVSGLRCRVGRPLYLDAIGCPGALIESIPVLSSAASKVEVCIGEQTFAALRRAPVARFGTVHRQGGRTGADPNARGDFRVQARGLRAQPGAPSGEEDHVGITQMVPGGALKIVAGTVKKERIRAPIER